MLIAYLVSLEQIYYSTINDADRISSMTYGATGLDISCEFYSYVNKLKLPAEILMDIGIRTLAAKTTALILSPEA